VATFVEAKNRDFDHFCEASTKIDQITTKQFSTSIPSHCQSDLPEHASIIPK
jgi:hypothetical protein